MTLDSKALEAAHRLRENLSSYDDDVAAELSTGGERADLWAEIDVNVEDLRACLATLTSLSARIEALEAENERLTAELDQADIVKRAAIDGWRDAETARAEASAAVKVRRDLSYGEKLIAEAIEHHFGGRDESYDECDGDTTVDDVWSAFDALTTEPAAPIDQELRDAAKAMGAAISGSMPLVGAAPQEAEALTKAMVNAAYNEGKNRGMTGMPNDFRAVLQAAGRAALAERGDG